MRRAECGRGEVGPSAGPVRDGGAGRGTGDGVYRRTVDGGPDPLGEVDGCAAAAAALTAPSTAAAIRTVVRLPDPRPRLDDATGSEGLRRIKPVRNVEGTGRRPLLITRMHHGDAPRSLVGVPAVVTCRLTQRPP